MAGGSAREREEQDCSHQPGQHSAQATPQQHTSATATAVVGRRLGRLPAPVRHRARTHRLCSVGVSKRGIMCIFRAAFKQGVERGGFFTSRVNEIE